VMAIRAGCKHLDLSVGLEQLSSLQGKEAAAIRGLLKSSFSDLSSRHIETLMVAGVLRHCRSHGLIRGTSRFLTAVAEGRLGQVLVDLGFDPESPD
jgi:hypothetical protein